MQPNFKTNPMKGVNLGGWLLMEGYILGGRIIAETTFKNGFKKHHEQKALCLICINTCLINHVNCSTICPYCDA